MAPCQPLLPTLDELLVQFRGLLEAHCTQAAPDRLGEGNLRCEGCVDCNRCRFCVQCVRCNDCSNCELCHDCRACTRSRTSRYCARSGYLEYCEGCEDSQYLVLCVDCTSCTQCFACVGLKGAEFSILNQRYSRKDYFPAVQALKKRLEEAIASGGVLPEIAAAGGGLWPPRGLDPAKEARVPAELAPVSAPEPSEPEVEPWLADIEPLCADDDEADATSERDTVAVSWAQPPPRPI